MALSILQYYFFEVLFFSYLRPALIGLVDEDLRHSLDCDGEGYDGVVHGATRLLLLRAWRGLAGGAGGGAGLVGDAVAVVAPGDVAAASAKRAEYRITGLAE